MQPTPGENVPTDVTDIMLWRLAIAVAENHRSDPRDPQRCVNLRCEYETYPCFAARAAEQALRASRANNVGTGTPEPAEPELEQPAPHLAPSDAEPEPAVAYEQSPWAA